MTCDFICNYSYLEEYLTGPFSVCMERLHCLWLTFCYKTICYKNLQMLLGTFQHYSQGFLCLFICHTHTCMHIFKLFNVCFIFHSKEQPSCWIFIHSCDGFFGSRTFGSFICKDFDNISKFTLYICYLIYCISGDVERVHFSLPNIVHHHFCLYQQRDKRDLSFLFFKFAYLWLLIKLSIFHVYLSLVFILLWIAIHDLNPFFLLLKYLSLTHL